MKHCETVYHETGSRDEIKLWSVLLFVPLTNEEKETYHHRDVSNPSIQPFLFTHWRNKTSKVGVLTKYVMDTYKKKFNEGWV